MSPITSVRRTSSEHHFEVPRVTEILPPWRAGQVRQQTADLTNRSLGSGSPGVRLSTLTDPLGTETW